MANEFGFYKGEDFFQMEFPPKQWLINNILYCGDSCLFLGGEKSGKSIMQKQLICSLTSGHPFLDKYEVIGPQKVFYLQLEGELSDTADRFRRMRTSVECVDSNLLLGYCQPMKLQSLEEMLKLIADVETVFVPQVVIIDPLYMAVAGGSLSDDAVIRDFIGNLRIMKMHFGCTLILVHHTHKTKLNQFGEVIFEGDGASFGSVFLKAWPDHVLLLRHDKKTDLRYLSCSTQRSGQIEKEITLELVQPDPLFFRELEKEEAKKIVKDNSGRIVKLLAVHPDGITAKEIQDRLGLPRYGFYRSLKYCKDRVEVVGKPPHSIYRLITKQSKSEVTVAL